MATTFFIFRFDLGDGGGGWAEADPAIDEFPPMFPPTPPPLPKMWRPLAGNFKLYRNH